MIKNKRQEEIKLLKIIGKFFIWMLILDIFTVNLYLFKCSYKMKKRTSKRIYSIQSFVILCNFIICSFLVFEYLGEIYFFNGVFKRIQDTALIITVAMTFVEGVVLFITILCTNNSTRVISQGNINTDQKVAWILKGIIISAVVTMSLISMSPYTIGNYIDSKRDVWETDRNFYTNKIKLSDIKIKDNSSIGVECSFEKIKIQKNKNETFYYIIKNGIIFFISENDYKKFQEDHRKKVTMYEKRCVYSYKSDKGKIYAEMMDKQLSFTEKKFSNEELAVIKQAIWKNCHNKIFVNECDNGTSGYDRDGRTVYTTIHILIKNTCLLGKIDGRSLIKPGRYDRLYPDSEMYVHEKNVKYSIKDKIMNYSAAVYYNNDGKKVHFVLDVIFYLIAAFYFGYSLMNDIDVTIQNKRKEEKCKNG